MKTSTWFFLFLIWVSGMVAASAQNAHPTLTVLNIDTKGVQLEPSQMGNLVRIELEKLNAFDVTDRYDVAYVIQKNNINITNCYGKLCLLEIGNIIKSDYMFTGSAELYGQTIVITFRLLNVKSGSIEKTAVMEFLNLPLEMQKMAGITIRKMFERPIDEQELARLSKPNNFDDAVNNPNKNTINLSGPRFGYSFIFGQNAERMRANSKEGGFEAYPASFLFGYQFEKQYLNEGKYQALFEMIPMIGGLDQQMFIPSFTLLNGFRNTKSGWEVAIGPSFTLSSYEQMIKFGDKYYTRADLVKQGVDVTGMTEHKVLNSNGAVGIGTGLVFGIGKTIKSGKMNIPLNLFATVPTREGWRIGISVGYNAKNQK